MRFLVYIFIICAFVGFKPMNNDNFHATTIKVDHHEASQKVKISVKFLTKDIETILKQEVSDSSFNNNLHSYVKKNLIIHINNNKKTVQLTGVNSSSNSTWAYFELSQIKEINHLKINNTLLMELQGQKNIHNLYINGERKSKICNSYDKIVEMKF